MYLCSHCLDTRCQVQFPCWKRSLCSVYYSAISSSVMCSQPETVWNIYQVLEKRGRRVGIVSIQALSLLQVCIFYLITSSLNVPCLTSLGDSLVNSTVVFLLPVLSMTRLVSQSPKVPQVPALGVNWHVLGCEVELSHGDANLQRWGGWTNEAYDSLSRPTLGQGWTRWS